MKYALRVIVSILIFISSLLIIMQGRISWPSYYSIFPTEITGINAYVIALSLVSISVVIALNHPSLSEKKRVYLSTIANISMLAIAASILLS